MKTLFQINVVINSGSTGRIAEEIGQLAIANGWKSYIAYGRNEQNSRSIKVKIGNRLSIYWHILMTRLFDRHGLASRIVTKKLIKQIQKINPDIIHLHNIHGYYLNYGLLFKYLKESRIPVVWTLHDCWTFTGHCANFSFVGCNKWKTGCNHCVQKKEYPKSLFIDNSYSNFISKKDNFLLDKDLLTLVPVSQWLANLCRQSFFKNIRIQLIHNGVNTDIFKPVSEDKKKEIIEKYGIKTNFLILGVAFTWSSRKGFDDFLKLSAFLSNEYSIMLVGLTEQQTAQLPKTITGIKRTENINELAAIYSTADVFVNPTWEDNFPTTNIESLACGTPVITYNTGGSIESINSETGFIVEQGDIANLKKTVDMVKYKGKQYFSAACRKHVIDFFKNEDCYMKYIHLYDNIIANFTK
jgi:glycosyltransferase involved in cell wall biosynthesis